MRIQTVFSKTKQKNPAKCYIKPQEDPQEDLKEETADARTRYTVMGGGRCIQL